MVVSGSDGLDVLNEDIIGELLPLLMTDNIKTARLCCKGWSVSIQRQTRLLCPMYLPDAAPKCPISNLESLQLPMVRPVQQQLLQLPPMGHLHVKAEPAAVQSAAAAAADVAAAGNPQAFTSLAPLRGLSAAGVQGLSHASVVNLTGQQLPYNVLKLLSQHLTRLKSLQLDYCRLPAPALLHATGLTTLQSLSLAGIRLQGGFHLHIKTAIATASKAAAGSPADAAAAAAAAIVSAAAAAADFVEQAGPDQQQPHDPAENVWSLTSRAARDDRKLLASAWVTEEQMTVAPAWQPQVAQSSLISWRSGRLETMLRPVDYGVLLDAVLLPQLRRLNLDLPADTLVRMLFMCYFTIL
jgi:cell division septum initiation protein DivIVA